MPTLHVLILAGGRSSRMGADKAFVPLAGIPLLQHVARTALQLSPHLTILGRDHPADWPFPDTSFLPDSPRSDDRTAGPMPALHAALTRLRTPVLLLACDMPLLTAATLELLLTAHHQHPNSPATLTLPATSSFLLPAPGTYNPSALPHLQHAIDHHKGSFQSLRHHVHLWPIPALHEPELLNLNTPGALAQAEQLLQTRPNPAPKEAGPRS